MDPKEQKEDTSKDGDRVQPRSLTPQSSDNRSDGRSEPRSDNVSKEKEPGKSGENICEVDATTPPDENSRNEIKQKAEIEEMANKARVHQKKAATQLSGSGIMATLKRAQDKQTAAPRRKLLVESTDEPLFKDKNFDDDMPVSTMAQIAEANPFLTDRSHRADLVLVKNNENEGNLFIGDRPFWQGNCVGDDVPMCERKTMSQICRELGANKTQFRELSAIAQTGNRSVFNPFLPRQKMEERNRLYFSAKQVEVNTIVTIIQTLQEEKENNEGKEAAPIKGKKKTKITRHPLTVGTITEPKMAVSYKKYEIKKRETVIFNRTGMGVCKKQPKKGELSDSSSSSSSSSSSTKSDKDTPPAAAPSPAPPTNQHHGHYGSLPPPPTSPKMPMIRKKATLRRGMSKKK